MDDAAKGRRLRLWFLGASRFICCGWRFLVIWPWSRATGPKRQARRYLWNGIERRELNGK